MAKRRNKTFRTITITILLLAAAGAGIYYFINPNRTRFVRYPAFGIDIPVNYEIHGIDVSRHQSNIDWAAVQAMQVKKVKIGFAFIKATEGLGRVDNEFRDNWENAGLQHIPRGAYHFFISSKSGKAQAENFIETVTLSKGDIPPVLDVETANGASVTDLQQRVKDFLVMVEQKYKVRPIIYTNVDFYNTFLSPAFDDYPLWVAHYLVQNKPRIKRDWIFWQHSENGHVNGIGALVDFNVFNGDSTDFKNLLIKK